MPKQEEKNQSKIKPPKVAPADAPFLTPKMMEAEEIKTLLSWEAPSRPFRKKDRSYYTTIAILVILLILIALLAREFLLIGALLALAFVAYVLAFVPPHHLTYRISTQGVTIGDDFYFWHFLDSFWFKEKEGSKVLHIQTRLRFPAQLMLVLGPPTGHSTLRDEPSGSDSKSSGQVDEDKVKKIVARFLPFYEVPYKSWFEKWTEGLQKHFPLENPHR